MSASDGRISYERYFDILRSPTLKRWRSAWRRREVQFALKFVLWTIGLWVLFWTFPALLLGIETVTVAATTSVAWGVGLRPEHLSSNVISFGGDFALEISSGCTAYEVAILFTAAVAGYDAPVGRRLAGLLVGLPAVFALNVLRLVSLGWMSVSLPQLFSDAHVLLWQAAFVLVVGLLWATWAARATPSTRKPDLPPLARLGARAAWFLAAFLTLGVIGLALGVDRAYFSVVSVAGLALARGVWGAEVSTSGDAAKQAYYFAQILSVLAVWLVHRRVPARARWRILGLTAPGVLVLQTGMVATSATSVRELRSYGHDILLMLVGVMAMLTWVLCAKAEARSDRLAARQDAARRPRLPTLDKRGRKRGPGQRSL